MFINIYVYVTYIVLSPESNTANRIKEEKAMVSVFNKHPRNIRAQ